MGVYIVRRIFQFKGILRRDTGKIIIETNKSSEPFLDYYNFKIVEFSVFRLINFMLVVIRAERRQHEKRKVMHF